MVQYQKNKVIHHIISTGARWFDHLKKHSNEESDTLYPFLIKQEYKDTFPNSMMGTYQESSLEAFILGSWGRQVALSIFYSNLH